MNDKEGFVTIRFLSPINRYNIACDMGNHPADWKVEPVGGILPFAICNHHLAVGMLNVPKTDLFLKLNPEDPR